MPRVRKSRPPKKRAQKAIAPVKVVGEEATIGYNPQRSAYLFWRRRRGTS